MLFFFFQAEDGIRDLVRSRGLGDVYKRQRRDRVAGVGLAVRLRDVRPDGYAARVGVLDDGHGLSLIHI